jgi:hypothetical protein
MASNKHFCNMYSTEKKNAGNKLLRSWDREKTRMISGYMSVALIDSYEIHLGFILLDCLQTSSSTYWIHVEIILKGSGMERMESTHFILG